MTRKIGLDVIRRRLDTLETLPRAVFLLCRIDDLDYGAIAWRLGIGINEFRGHYTK
jgi:DNA-directed RNA polymerase specialized sigma24 family protein